MFFPRNLFVLGLFVLLVALAVEAKNEPVNAAEILSQADPRVLNIILDLLIQAFKWATKTCIQEAAAKCGHLWWNIPKLIQCAGDYLAENKGRCLLQG